MTVFGQDGGTLIGCGITDTDMVMYGVMVIIIIGQDHFPIMEAYMTPLTLSGVIIIHFIMEMDMDTDMAVITHGGDHIIRGTITPTIAEEIGILQYH